MFINSAPRSVISSAASMVELIYHASVRTVRKAHGNALMSILVSITQSVLFVLFFYFMFTFLDLRGMMIRGDFVIFLLTGVFMFLTHNQTMSAVLGSEGPTSPMMQHAPMNTVISIMAAMLSTLYLQVMAIVIVLFVYDVALNPHVLTEVIDPMPVIGMLILSWLSGAAVGLMLLGAKPWMPGFVNLVSMIYRRANMICSGKMFVANSLPSVMLPFFAWNPLFHTIDQARGYAFINYVPRNTQWDYVVYFSLALIMIGMMGEFYTRRHASSSWSARR